MCQIKTLCCHKVWPNMCTVPLMPNKHFECISFFIKHLQNWFETCTVYIHVCEPAIFFFLAFVGALICLFGKNALCAAWIFFFFIAVPHSPNGTKWQQGWLCYNHGCIIVRTGCWTPRWQLFIWMGNAHNNLFSMLWRSFYKYETFKRRVNNDAVCISRCPVNCLTASFITGVYGEMFLFSSEYIHGDNISQ